MHSQQPQTFPSNPKLTGLEAYFPVLVVEVVLAKLPEYIGTTRESDEVQEESHADLGHLGPLSLQQ